MSLNTHACTYTDMHTQVYTKEKRVGYSVSRVKNRTGQSENMEEAWTRNFNMLSTGRKNKSRAGVCV